MGELKEEGLEMGDDEELGSVVFSAPQNPFVSENWINSDLPSQFWKRGVNSFHEEDRKEMGYLKQEEEHREGERGNVYVWQREKVAIS